MKITITLQVVCLWLLSVIFSCVAYAEEYSVNAVPAWVKTRSVDTAQNKDPGKNVGGVFYSLVDYQMRNVDNTKARYRHIVAKALNTSGVEELSRISVDFDPEYEKLSLHSMIVYRGKEISDRLKSSKISVIQREAELEYQIYDGSRTLNAFLEDIQVGDSVEYSYTLEGSNPVLADTFSAYVPLQWSAPVGQSFYRLLWPTDKPLHIKNHQSDVQASTVSEGGLTEYVWQQQDKPAVTIDESVPSWYDPIPGVYISNMNTWGQVVAWALPLYQVEPQSTKLQQTIDRLKSAGATDTARVMAALAFVQNEVRYLGIEIGTRSHKPGKPDDVLAQRFGDCKDKSRLLVTLLKGMGIEAYPALVHNSYGRMLLDVLPTPLAFNHVVVVVKSGDKRFWLDPSLTYQAGSLENVYTPDYGYALVLAAGQTALQQMADDIKTVHTKWVYEEVDVSHDNSVPANYKIWSGYEGYYADSTRQYFAEESRNKIGQDYLNYLAQLFPGVTASSDITVHDNLITNAFETTEAYQIKNIWAKTDDSRYLQIDLRSYLVSDNLKNVSSPIRTMPYNVRHPVAYKHRTLVKLTPDAKFDNEADVVENPAFRFSRTVTASKGELLIDYDYRSRKDHVLPADIAVYAEHMDKVRSLATFSINKPDPVIGVGEKPPGWTDINWQLVFLSIAVFWMAFFLLGNFMYLSDPARAPNGEDLTPASAKLQGIHGWLLLHAIHVILSPILVLAGAKDFVYLFSEVQWSIVSEKFHSDAFMALIIVEWVMQIIVFIASSILVVMFFQKRNTYPRSYIIVQCGALLYTLLDMLVLHGYFNEQVGALEPKDWGELVGTAFGTVVWCSYMLTSKRVKATFIHRRTAFSGHGV